MALRSNTHYVTGDNKVFQTLEQATAYADWYFSKTRIVLEVKETNRKVTHIWVA